MDEVSKVSQAQKDATNRYRREKVKEIKLRFYPSHAELWEHLKAQEHTAEYLRGLIREDLLRCREKEQESD